jgi:hypothetical protein
MRPKGISLVLLMSGESIDMKNKVEKPEVKPAKWLL